MVGEIGTKQTLVLPNRTTRRKTIGLLASDAVNYSLCFCSLMVVYIFLLYLPSSESDDAEIDWPRLPSKGRFDRNRNALFP